MNVFPSGHACQGMIDLRMIALDSISVGNGDVYHGCTLSAWVQASQIHINILNHFSGNTVSFAALFQGSQIRGNGFRNLFEY
jgi:hypothetical protein